MTNPGIGTVPASAWSLEIGFVSDPGRERDRNEDACAVFVPYRGEEAFASISGVFAVADGMGGHDAGDVASRHVVEAITSTFAPGPQADPLALPVPEVIENLVRRVHGELREMASAQAAERGMGSTLALGVVEGGTLYLTSVGDSRFYRLRAGRLERLTEDQSWVAEQVRAGLLSSDEAEQHPKRNMLTHCLGIGALPPLEVRQAAIETGDRFLLCSDGLHTYLQSDELVEITQTRIA